MVKTFSQHFSMLRDRETHAYNCTTHINVCSCTLHNIKLNGNFVNDCWTDGRLKGRNKKKSLQQFLFYFCMTNFVPFTKLKNLSRYSWTIWSNLSTLRLQIRFVRMWLSVVEAVFKYNSTASDVLPSYYIFTNGNDIHRGYQPKMLCWSNHLELFKMQNEQIFHK